MAVRDEKMSNFLAAINKYAEEQRSKIQSEVENFKHQELEKAEEEILIESYQLIQREMNAMRTGISQDISRREMESRKALFEKRREITAKVFGAAREQLLAYTQSPEYPELLEASARRLAPLFEADDAALLVKKEDLLCRPAARRLRQAVRGPRKRRNPHRRSQSV